MARALLLMSAIVTLVACGTPAMTSTMRSNFPPDWRLEADCVTLGRGSIADEVRQRYTQGWRIAYFSEYTSTARAGNPTIACFERPIGSAPQPRPGAVRRPAPPSEIE